MIVRLFGGFLVYSWAALGAAWLVGSFMVAAMPQARGASIEGVITTGPAFAAVPPWSEEFVRGWCAGYRQAVELVWRNRNHYRGLVQYPVESREESHKRIYAGWPPVAPAGYVSAYKSEIVDKMLHLEMAGIDLYVVLPELAPGTMMVQDGDGFQRFTCP